MIRNMIYVVALVLTVGLVASLTRLATTDIIGAPFRLWVRKKYGITSMPAQMLECDRCTGYWVAMAVMPLVLAVIGYYARADLVDWALLVLAWAPSAHSVSYFAFHLLLLEEN